MEKYTYATPYEELLNIVGKYGSSVLQSAVKLKAVEKALSTKTANLTPKVQAFLLEHSDCFVSGKEMAEEFGTTISCIKAICEKLGCEVTKIIMRVVDKNGKAQDRLYDGFRLSLNTEEEDAEDVDNMEVDEA